MTALILGISGFIGQHLAKELRSRGLEVVGTYWGSEKWVEDPAYQLDILEGAKVQEVIHEVQPEVVFHLAAESAPLRARVDPQRCYRVNLEGTVNVAAACASLPESALLVFPSTSHVYGMNAPESRGLQETDLCSPVSPYGIAKWAAELHLEFMKRQSGLRTVIFRLFNQMGPGQRGPFFFPEMAESIVRLEQERPSHAVIRTGNLNLLRDFLDVRDAVRALAMTTDSERWPVMNGKVYNLGRGEGLCLAEMLQILRDSAFISIATETDPKKLRSNDPPIIRADISRFQTDTGWKPERPIEESLKEILEETRKGN